MLIRFATHEDTPKLIANWQQHEQGRFGHIAFDEAKFAATMKSLVDAKESRWAETVSMTRFVRWRG